MKQTIFLCLALVLNGCSSKVSDPEAVKDVRSEGWSSSGGDLVLNGRNPWYLGKQPVVYCIKSEQVSLSTADIQALVRAVLLDWRRTLKALRADDPVVVRGLKKEIAVGMTTEFTEKSCDQNPELIFEFGTKRANARNKIAEAYREGFDLTTGRAISGHVWIAPDSGPDNPSSCTNYWNQYDKEYLRNVLLHELGHVFGVGHDVAPYYQFMQSDFPAKQWQDATLDCQMTRNSPPRLHTSWVFYIGNFARTGNAEKVSLYSSGLSPQHSEAAIQFNAGPGRVGPSGKPGDFISIKSKNHFIQFVSQRVITGGSSWLFQSFFQPGDGVNADGRFVPTNVSIEMGGTVKIDGKEYPAIAKMGPRRFVFAEILYWVGSQVHTLSATGILF